MFFECRKFDSQGEIKSTEQIIASLDLKNKNNFIKLKKGMIVSNEPGIYLENKLGIRIENLVYIDGNNKNLFFKNLTFAPLEKDLINENMLTKIEKDYIFSYHLETYSKLSAYLNNKERKWLAKLIQ